MQVTMDMCSGNVDREEYGNEVMCAGWNPEIRSMGDVAAALAGRFVGLQLQQVREARQAMPTDVAAMEIDTFLRKMYAAQQ